MSLRRRAPPWGGLATAPNYVACVTAAFGSAGLQSQASNEFRAVERRFTRRDQIRYSLVQLSDPQNRWIRSQASVSASVLVA
jgi:hypothetical protein